MNNVVEISRRAKKQISKIPNYLADKLDAWIEAVETDGLQHVRKLPGYHDEPLKGPRSGQRSFRLNKDWRVIYIVNRHDDLNEDSIEVILIEEVNKHDY